MERVRRHTASDSSCVVCGDAIECIDHILRCCPPAVFVWTELIKPNQLDEFLEMDLCLWVATNNSDVSRFPIRTLNWDIMFGNILWNLWLARNATVFNSPSQDCQGVIERSRRQVELYVQAQESRCAMRAATSTPVVVVSWSPPKDHWIKINTDARNSTGTWCFGFTKFLGICSVTDAEIWGAFLGLHYAWEMGFRHVMLEMDSLDVIRIVKRDYSSLHSLRGHIQDLWGRDWRIQISDVRRDGNRVADACARMASSSSFEPILFHTPPASVVSLLHADTLIGGRKSLAKQAFGSLGTRMIAVELNLINILEVAKRYFTAAIKSALIIGHADLSCILIRTWALLITLLKEVAFNLFNNNFLRIIQSNFGPEKQPHMTQDEFKNTRATIIERNIPIREKQPTRKTKETNNNVIPKNDKPNGSTITIPPKVRKNKEKAIKITLHQVYMSITRP
ncbi:hypothetical protein GQ457_02G015370 [Hibiscus cannabinus]